MSIPMGEHWAVLVSEEEHRTTVAVVTYYPFVSQDSALAFIEKLHLESATHHYRLIHVDKTPTVKINVVVLAE